jgi:hypothetical protein
LIPTCASSHIYTYDQMKMVESTGALQPEIFQPHWCFFLFVYTTRSRPLHRTTFASPLTGIAFSLHRCINVALILTCRQHIGAISALFITTPHFRFEMAQRIPSVNEILQSRNQKNIWQIAHAVLLQKKEDGHRDSSDNGLFGLTSLCKQN